MILSCKAWVFTYNGANVIEWRRCSAASTSDGYAVWHRLGTVHISGGNNGRFFHPGRDG